MKNQYMFFNTQSFEDLDLGQYRKTDISIEQTAVHIYEFECIESDSCCNDETRAKMLDGLSQQLSEKYPDAFQVIYSESSQFFCRELYPMIVELETKLRQALYISRALFENSSVTSKSFLFSLRKEEKPIEAFDFGEIYEAIFTDQNFRKKLNEKYTGNLTKNDLIKLIQKIDEKTIWRNMVGASYHYIEHHFLQIKGFRNDVMHNHLISFATYTEARGVLQSANVELTQVINDKLITNDSKYLNAVNIFEVISNIVCSLQLVTSRLGTMADTEGFSNFLKLFGASSDEILNKRPKLTAPESCDAIGQEDEDNA